MFQVAEPQTIHREVNGLKHRLSLWGAAGAPTLILLLHGYLDTGRSWDFVATALATAFPEASIIAPDWRGHGDTEAVGAGGYYHFYDYVADLADLIAAYPAARRIIVGHSMGGNIATYFTGAFPEQVQGLALLESMIVPDAPLSLGPERVRGWVKALQWGPRGHSRLLADLTEVAQRLRITMPHISDDVALYLAGHASRQVEGGFTWRFDPLHRTRGPSPFRWERMVPFLKEIRCPALLVEGAESGHIPHNAARRYAHLPGYELVKIPGASHAMHVEAPLETADALISFIHKVLQGQSSEAPAS